MSASLFMILVIVGVGVSVVVTGVLAARSAAWLGGITAATAVLAVEVSIILAIWGR